MNPEITEAQLDLFHEQGYLVLPEVFTADDVHRMREEADRILGLIINSSLANQRKSGRLDIRELPNGEQVIRKIQPINDLSLYLTQVANDDRLLAPMRQIMNDELVLMEEKLNYKEPLPEALSGIEALKIDDRFPVHNDWAYYKAQNYPQSIISSGICFDECTEDSGPIHVWPGSHKRHLEHEPMDNGLQVLPHLIDFRGGVDVLAPGGSVLLFHVLLVHNSRPNVSNRPRRLMIYSHYPQSANLGFDVRNGPKRLSESPYEWGYHHKKVREEYYDQFQPPQFD